MPNTQYSMSTSNNASAETPVELHLSWIDGGRLCEIIPSTDTFSWVGRGKLVGFFGSLVGSLGFFLLDFFGGGGGWGVFLLVFFFLACFLV